MPHPWRSSRQGWIKPSASWFSCACPSSLQGSWNRWPLKFPSNSKDSVIQEFRGILGERKSIYAAFCVGFWSFLLKRKKKIAAKQGVCACRGWWGWAQQGPCVTWPCWSSWPSGTPPLPALGQGSPIGMGIPTPAVCPWWGQAPSQCSQQCCCCIFSFPFWFLFFPSNFGHVLDSFYLLSHQSSPRMGAAPHIPIPWAGWGDQHLKIKPVNEMWAFWGFLLLFFPSFPTVCSMYERVGWPCDVLVLRRTGCCNQITVQLLMLSVSEAAARALVFWRWIFLVVNHNLCP